MRKTVTTIRCLPRFGYDHAQVRTIDLDLCDCSNVRELAATLREWFTLRGMPEALFDTGADDYGFYAIINDEAYYEEWGTPVL